MLFNSYAFKCKFKTDAALPAYKGSTFRGAFGLAMKKVVCALKRQSCGQCLLNRRCIYALVFKTETALALSQNAKIQSPPHPYVIEPPLSSQIEYPAGDTFNFNLLLFGNTNESLPYFIYAVTQMGKIGIGKKRSGKRGQFKLEKVSANGRTVYALPDDRLYPLASIPELTIPQTAMDSRQVATVQITMDTPLRLKFKNKLKADLPFHVLIRAALRRIAALFSIYGNEEPELDYTGLIARAADVAIVEDRLHWFDWKRYSNRQNQKMLMGGLTGSVVYKGVLTEFIAALTYMLKPQLRNIAGWPCDFSQNIFRNMGTVPTKQLVWAAWTSGWTRPSIQPISRGKMPTPAFHCLWHPFRESKN